MAGSHASAGERGGERRRAWRGPWHDDGPAQVVEGRERRGRKGRREEKEEVVCYCCCGPREGGNEPSALFLFLFPFSFS